MRAVHKLPPSVKLGMIEYQPMAARKPINQLDEIVSFGFPTTVPAKRHNSGSWCDQIYALGKGDALVCMSWPTLIQHIYSLIVILLDGRFIAPASKGCKQNLGTVRISGYIAG